MTTIGNVKCFQLSYQPIFLNPSMSYIPKEIIKVTEKSHINNDNLTNKNTKINTFFSCWNRILSYKPELSANMSAGV